MSTTSYAGVLEMTTSWAVVMVVVPRRQISPQLSSLRETADGKRNSWIISTVGVLAMKTRMQSVHKLFSLRETAEGKRNS